MSRDPQDPNVRSVGASSDDELILALRRAVRTDLPSATKMGQLAERLGPMMVTSSAAATPPWRWIGVIALASVFAVGAVSLRRHADDRDVGAPAAQGQASPLQNVGPSGSSLQNPSAADVPPTRDERREVPPPVVSIDSLPTASAVPPRARAVVEPTCAGEIELVERADAALRTGDPRRALELTREHAQRCAEGTLVQERERIAIEALAQLGRTSEVRARARSFEKRFPSSPHVWRIRSLAEREPE